MSMVLKSFAAGQWVAASTGFTDIPSAIDGHVVARASSAGLDFGAMVADARTVGGPALRAMTFHERADRLKALALHLSERKEPLYALAADTGATKGDNLIDIDGGIGTLFAYASRGRRELPDEHFVIEGPPEALSKGGTFVGAHLMAQKIALEVKLSVLRQSLVESSEEVRRVREELAAVGVRAEVQGRPKHLYSIWRKMQGKDLALDRVFDVRALRVIVDDVPACYAALSRVHERYRAVPGEYDDYIARPKSNGYQSLHTVVLGDDGRPLEVQIRTAHMHEHAESGVAAHWAYKEAGAKGYAGVSAAGNFEERIAEARKTVLRQLLAWERDYVGQATDGPAFDDRIYVFTPQATVIELPARATPVDFAYSLHTDLGHRCRGARVDGMMVPLNTPLANGQTVEVITTKEGAPSLDWLNPELGYLASHRARAKVRAWFNAQAQSATIARGRELVEKLLQREGRTAIKLDDLAAQLGFKGAEALFELVGKDEFSLRNIETLLRPAEPPADAEQSIPLKRARTTEGGVLVVGVESLLTTLARCCRPAPPDAIGGYVTRGKGVAIHRSSCSNFCHMAQVSPQRVIAVAWGEADPTREAAYPVDVQVEAADRSGLLRDISEVFVKEKMNVTGVHTQSVKDASGGTAHMTFTVEVNDATRLAAVLRMVAQVAGVRHARRR